MDATTVITTASGAKVDYLNPDNICWEDLALGLSRQPRYAGQTTRFYSVAQHCLLVTEMVPHCGAYGLIHDAQEAFLCDIPTPAKEAMRAISGGPSAYDLLEDKLHAAICKRIGLVPENPISIRLADVKARRVEIPVLHPNAKWVTGLKKHRPALERILALPDGGRWEWLRAIQEAETRIAAFRLSYRL